MSKVILCPCGSGLESFFQKDARGIPLCRTCTVCHEDKMRRYRPEVLTDSNYYADELIEPELPDPWAIPRKLGEG